MAVEGYDVYDDTAAFDDDDPTAVEEEVVTMQYPPPLRPCSKRMMLRGDDVHAKPASGSGAQQEDEQQAYVDPSSQVNVTTAMLRDEINMRHEMFDDYMEHRRLKALKVVVENKADALESLKREQANKQSTTGNMELPIVDFAMHHPSIIYQPSNIRRADREKNKSYKKTRDDRDRYNEYAAEKEIKEKMDAQIAAEEAALQAQGLLDAKKKKPETIDDRLGEAARMVRERKKREAKIMASFKRTIKPSQREMELADKALEYGIGKLEGMEQYELGCLKIKRDADQAEANAAAISKYKKDLVRRKREARGVMLSMNEVDPEMAALQKMTLANMIKRYKILSGRISKKLKKAAVKKKNRWIRKYKKNCKLLYMYYIWVISHSEMLTDWNAIFEAWYAKMMKKRAQARSNRLMMRQLKRDQREQAYVSWKEAMYVERARIKREAEEAKIQEMRDKKAAEKAKKKQEKLAKEIEERRLRREKQDRKKVGWLVVGCY